MALRSIAILGVAVLAWSAGALALVDPGVGDGAHAAPIEASEEVGDVALNALHATGARNVRMIVEHRNRSTTLRRLDVRYDVSDGELATIRTPGADRFYATTAEAWQLDEEGGVWINRRSEWDPGGPFHHHSLVATEGADLAVRDRNESTLSLVVRDTDTAYAIVTGIGDVRTEEPDIEASLRIDIDVETGLVTQVTYSVTWPSDEGEPIVRQTTYRFSHWGETTVGRPLAIPYTLPELLEDVGRVR